MPFGYSCEHLDEDLCPIYYNYVTTIHKMDDGFPEIL